MGAGTGTVQQIPQMAAQQLAADPGQVLGRPEQMFASFQQALPRLQDPAQRLEAARRLSMVMEPPPVEQLAAMAQQYVPPGWNPMGAGTPNLAAMQQGEAVLGRAAGPEVLGGPPSSQPGAGPMALGAIAQALGAGRQAMQRRPLPPPVPMPMQARPSRGIVNPYLAVRRRG